jgi:predicted RNase H-like nuclease (RuvC/YqgF family)
MSPIGKIFLLINFALSVAFLFWASTALGKSAETKAALEADLNKVRTERDGLQKDKSDLAAQLNAEKGAKERLTIEKDQAAGEALRNKEDLDAQKRANEQLRADIAKIQETLGGYNQTIQALESAKDAAVAEARNLERERDTAKGEASDAVEAQRNAEEALRTANANIADLEKRIKATRGDLAALQTKYENLRAMANIPESDVAAQAAIDATVVKVDYSLKPGLVAISAGSNQGVKKGYTFDIYSGGTYKGRVQVETVHPDMCSALVTLQRAEIRAGDSAATQL